MAEEKIVMLEKEHASLEGQIKDLAENKALDAQTIGALRQRLAAMETAAADLRGNESTEKQKLSPFQSLILEQAKKAALIDEELQKFPEYNIPEISLLKESDWIEVATNLKDWNSEKGIQKGMMQLRNEAKQAAMRVFGNAIRAPRQDGPPKVGQQDDLIRTLQNSLDPSIREAVFARYEILNQQQASAEGWKSFSNDGDVPAFLIRERSAVSPSGQAASLTSQALRDARDTPPTLAIYVNPDGSVKKLIQQHSAQTNQ